ncbi:MAG: GNAT family N-acetyltransferase, partial [Mobilitalea sp.]
MVVKIDNTKKAEPLFCDWQESLIWSCLQNIMGSIYVDNLEKPLSAMAVLGDFCLFAGLPNKELVLYKPEECIHNFIIMVPQNDKWAELIVNGYGDKASKVKRYAMKKEQNVFDKEKLQKVVHSLSTEYSLKMIEEDIFNQCRSNDWSRDLVSQYKDYEMYQRLGIGAVVLKDGIPVSGASAYSRYQEGIEIEIDTK